MMKEVDINFRRTYHSVLIPELKRMEFIRIILFVIFIIGALYLASLNFFTLPLLFSADIIGISMVLIVLFFTVAGIFFFYHICSFVLNLILKNKLMTVLLTPFKTFKVNKHSDISSLTIRKSRIVENFLFKYTPDKIDGLYKNVNIRFNTSLLFRILYTAKKIRLKNVFSGYFIEMDMNKRFSGHTILHSGMTDFISHRLDLVFWNGNADLDYDMQKVTLEDVDFNKIWDEIYTTDQVEARYILTPTMMERLKALNSTLKSILNICSLRLSFRDNNVLLALKVSSFGKLLKLCSLSKPLYKQDKDICAFKDMLISVLEIVDTLKLDSKIGL